ncbi:MAG: hypothetical protein AABY22_15990, partial [Nanoarchaeota archaeon]
HTQEVYEKPMDELDYDDLHLQIIEKMRPILSIDEMDVYQMAFVQHKTDKDIIKVLRKTLFKTNKSACYRFVVLTKKKIIVEAKRIVGELGL